MPLQLLAQDTRIAPRGTRAPLDPLTAADHAGLERLGTCLINPIGVNSTLWSIAVTIMSDTLTIIAALNN